MFLYATALALDVDTTNVRKVPNPSERQRIAVERCLANWGEHPFGESPEIHEAHVQVRVLQRNDKQNIGSPTDAPQLIYVEPNVNVLSRVQYALTNPKGWYCLNVNVDVLSKITFDMHCDARLTSSRSSATIMGADDAGKGVTVLGSVRVNRDCKAEPAVDAPAPAPEPERPKAFHPAE